MTQEFHLKLRNTIESLLPCPPHFHAQLQLICYVYKCQVQTRWARA
jgi:hypothetical protein